MIKYLEKENFEDLIKDGVYLIDFYADWCGPCKMLAPVLEELENIDIIKINTDIHQELATKYGVMSIPTIVITKDGEEVAKEIGFRNKEELEELIKKHS